MEQEIRLLCSGYGAETGSDLLAVKLFENTETGEVHTEVTGGIRQGDSPSFSLMHGGFLYTVAELVGEKHAYIYQYRLSEDGIPVPTGKKIFLPGGELCHLYAGKKALYASCYGTGDFFAVDYDLEKIRWHRSPGSGRLTSPYRFLLRFGSLPDRPDRCREFPVCRFWSDFPRSAG